MQFDFVAMQSLYLSLARRDPAPLVAALTAPRSSDRRCNGRTSSGTTMSSLSTS